MESASLYRPHVLRDYALVADGERGALIGPRGDVVWLCVPRWDSDAVFSSLLGGGGVYVVAPDDPRFVWGGYYEQGTLIWRSRWVTVDGIVESREALAFPGDPRRATLLRRVSALDYAARIKVVLDPSAGFGCEPVDDLHRHGDVWTLRTGNVHLRWQGAGAARRTKAGLEMTLDLEPGRHHDLVLEIADHPLDDEPRNADQAWEATAYAWRTAVPSLSATFAPGDAQRAYTVMRGLTTAGGGMVAAATMSLPERAEAGRNYDYRYVWIRDQCFAGQAVAATEGYDLLDDAVRFVTDRLLADGPQMKPAYRPDGSPVPDEHQLTHLTGYPGGSDKVGNWVNKQFQLDAFGEALLLLAAAARHDRLDTEHWKAVETAVDVIRDRWTKRDAGIWELDPAFWTHSRLICVAGLRAAAAHASAPEAADWLALADTILSRTANECVHSSGRWQRAVDDEEVDAALLLPIIRGATPADDPRAVATIDAVRRELAQDHFVYRFRQGPGPLAEAEGAFILCGFAMALAEQQQGNAVSAARYFERNRAACGTPGLFSEEFDVDQRQLRGNLPQAFVHALMLEAAGRLPHDVSRFA
jgi:GH15 family glucan-1,4-alpha-glucosidase